VADEKARLGAMTHTYADTHYGLRDSSAWRY